MLAIGVKVSELSEEQVKRVIEEHVPWASECVVQYRWIPGRYFSPRRQDDEGSWFASCMGYLATLDSWGIVTDMGEGTWDPYRRTQVSVMPHDQALYEDHPGTPVGN